MSQLATSTPSPTAQPSTRAAQNPSQFPGGVVPAVEPNLPPEYAAAGYAFSGRYAYTQNFLSPYKGYGQMEYYKFDGTSNYNALQVSVQRRFARGLTFGGVYTWSKTLTTSSADESFVDPFNPRKYSYGVASYDRPNVGAINYVYDLPSLARRFNGPHWLSYVTDGYQLSGLASIMSGQPVRNALYSPANQITGGSQFSKTPPLFVGVDHQGNLILPTIGQPNLGAPGSLRQGGMVTWDSSIFKNFPIGEASKGRSIQLRGEFFNVLNHPNILTRDYNANRYAANLQRKRNLYAALHRKGHQLGSAHSSLWSRWSRWPTRYPARGKGLLLDAAIPAGLSPSAICPVFLSLFPRGNTVLSRALRHASALLLAASFPLFSQTVTSYRSTSDLSSALGLREQSLSRHCCTIASPAKARESSSIRFVIPARAWRAWPFRT